MASTCWLMCRYQASSARKIPCCSKSSLRKAGRTSSAMLINTTSECKGAFQSVVLEVPWLSKRRMPAFPAPHKISALQVLRRSYCKHNLQARSAQASQFGCSTYGDKNSRWLSQELGRLLSSQRTRGEGLVLTRGQWHWIRRDESHYQLRGKMEFHNITKRFEIFIPEVSGKLQLLAKGSLDGVLSAVQITPRHPGGDPARDDQYWRAYITRAGARTSIEVLVDIRSNAGKALRDLQAARLDIEYISYGPHGRTAHAQHVILPLLDVEVQSKDVHWPNISSLPGSSLLPIHTHLLSHLDDPLEVLRTYVLPHARTGDIIAIGETPLAIMQGRFRHPRSIRPGLVAGLACRLFHPTSSLATACGMQALVDISGRIRVVVAVIIAIIARLLGQRGVFYRVAGEQARLIDDVTGTLPPYDQFITLGPVRVQSTVNALSAKTGCEVAVVDVNDLRKVQVLAASPGVDHKFLRTALLDNPAAMQWAILRASYSDSLLIPGSGDRQATQTSKHQFFSFGSDCSKSLFGIYGTFWF